MKKLVNLLGLAMLIGASAHASLVTITLENPNQFGAPGQTLSFYGTITNTDVNSNDAPVYLNATSFNLTLTDATDTHDNNFFANVPISLASGASSGRIDLFDITLANPGTLPLGTYSGIYGLLGGRDGGDLSAQDNLGQTDFSVTVTPEPGYLALLGAGLGMFALLRRRQNASQ